MAGGLSFDPSGDLWAANASSVVEFTKAQLARSGAPKPVVTLSPITCSIGFDSSGDLWQGSSGTRCPNCARRPICAPGVAQGSMTSGLLLLHTVPLGGVRASRRTVRSRPVRNCC